MSALSDAIVARAKARPVLTVKLSDFMTGATDDAFTMRALSVSETDDATRDAVSYRKSMIAQLPEKYVTEFLEDPTFLADAKVVEKLWRACRTVADPSVPAFESAQWMRENFTTAELGCLFGQLERATLLASGADVEAFTTEQVESVAEIAALTGGDELMAFTKPTLCRLFSRLAARFVDVRDGGIRS